MSVVDRTIVLPEGAGPFFQQLVSGLLLARPKMELSHELVQRVKSLTRATRVELQIGERSRGLSQIEPLRVCSEGEPTALTELDISHLIAELGVARRAVDDTRSPLPGKIAIPFGSDFVVAFRDTPPVRGVLELHLDTQTDRDVLRAILSPNSLSVLSQLMLVLYGGFGRNERLGEYAHNVKHYIMIGEELVRAALESEGDRRQRALQKLATNLKRVLLETTTVLLADKSDSGALVFSPLPIRLTEIVDEVVSESGVLFEAAHTPVRIALPKSVAESRIDPALFPIVIQNLLSNAIKYADPNTPVDVRVEEGNGHVRLDVVNISEMLSDEDRRSAFDRYYRGANALHKPGSGLGLYLVRRIVELHGGKVKLDQSESREVTFSVELPVIE